MDLRARALRHRDMRDDRAFRRDESAVRLQHGLMGVRQVVAWRKAPQLGSTEMPMRQFVRAASGKRTLDHGASRRPRIDRARDEEELLAEAALQFAPVLIGTAQQRHVGGILEIGEPDDPVEAVRGAHRVGNVEALEPEHPHTAPGKLPAGGRAHAADTDHDDIVGVWMACHVASSGRIEGWMALKPRHRRGGRANCRPSRARCARPTSRGAPSRRSGWETRRSCGSPQGSESRRTRSACGRAPCRG